MLVSRLFNTSDDADAAVRDLRKIGFREAAIRVETQAKGTTVTVDAPVGYSGIATHILQKSQPGDTGTPVVTAGTSFPAAAKPAAARMPGAVADDAAPLSSALGWKVLIDDPAPLSAWAGWRVLLKDERPRANLLDDPAPLSSKTGMTTLIDNPAPLSSAIGMKTLLDDPAPLSKKTNQKVLLDEPAPLSAKLGWKTLLNDPTPLSTLLKLPVLTEKQ